MKNHLFDFLDKVEGLTVGSTTANIEKEKTRQGYGEKCDVCGDSATHIEIHHAETFRRCEKHF